LTENICINCNEKIGILGKKISLTKKSGEKLLYCSKCYDSIPKEEKLVLSPIDKKTGSGINVGYAFGLAGGAGYAAGQMEAIMKPIKQYNLTLNEINEYGIMNFNKHFLIADMSQKSAMLYEIGKNKKKNKLDELAKNQFNNEYEMLDNRDKKIVKKEWKRYIKENMKQNKRLKNLKIFIKNELGE
jgi:hypothetical protein